MLLQKSLFTIISKTTILLVNFSLVIFTSQIWQSEGRGEIAFVMANITLITILNNIFSGGTISYHAPKINKGELFSISFLGSLIFSLIGTFAFCLYYGFANFNHLLIISLLSSLSNSITLYFLGTKNIKWFNILTLLPPIFVLFYLSILYFILKITTLDTFFYSYYLALTTTLFIGLKITSIPSFKNIKLHNIRLITKYGFNNEISNFFQFLNYRFSYFFIAEFIGFNQLGVFSVAVAVSEALWIVSKSISAIHFSETINSKKFKKDLILTSKAAKQNLVFSILLAIILMLVPNTFFTFIFGVKFTGVKTITMYLIPGIIAIATSNLYGHYFAAIGKLTILKNKSYLGFISTLLTSILLIPKYGLLGACLSLNISHITSSIYLFYMFLKHKKTIFK